MSVTRPSNVPRWADNGGTTTEPTSGKKDIGWEAEEEPPADYMNWWQLLVYQWVLVLQQLAADAVRHTLTFLTTQNGTFQWNSGTALLTVTAVTSAKAEAAFTTRMAVGEKLTAVTVKGNRAASTTVVVSVVLVDGTGAVTSLGTVTTPSASGAYTATPTVTAHTLAAGEMIFIDVLTRTVGDVIYDCEYTVTPQNLA